MGRLETVLGSDHLVLRRFIGADHLNALFDYEAECLSIDPDVDFDALIGTHATVSLVTHEGSEQPFDGIVTEARWLGADSTGNQYALRLQPWFFLASFRRNQRIFHNMSVVEILSELLADYEQAGALVVNLSQSYPVLEYTVQFRESDMDFAKRLMERHGINYHFVHRAGEHDMVLTDICDPHVSIGARPFKPAQGHHQEDIEHFFEWRPARRIGTGAVRMTDYNFKKPRAAMEVEFTGDAAHMHGQIESFDWPGDFLEQGRGKVMAQMGGQRERGQANRIEAKGDIVSLRGGILVELSGDKVPGHGAEYMCLSAYHSYQSDSYGTGGEAPDTEDADKAYAGRYVLLPATAPLVPERKTARADVIGPQTAAVVGEGEIDCDEFGRILVQFHWDLEAAYSMRCRVSQNWAGKGWGGMVIPRIGMEVVVEFLDGDPDQPLVTGCVYNGQNDVPYPLPEHKTRSILRSDTHEGAGFNELRIEDKDGLEEIHLHAERDMNSVVRRDDYKSVGRHDFVEVATDRAISVGGNSINETKGTVEIASGRGTVISSGSIGMSSRSFTSIVSREEPEFSAAKASLLSMESAMPTGGITLQAETMLNEVVGMSRSTTIGSIAQEYVGKEKSIQVGKIFQVNSGATVAISTADNMALEAGDRIDIVCGAASIRMTSDGKIEIKGSSIKLDAGKIDMN